MRQAIPTALEATGGSIAVVCGAWHAPALAEPLGPASIDAATLRGLPRRKRRSAGSPGRTHGWPRHPATAPASPPLLVPPPVHRARRRCGALAHQGGWRAPQPRPAGLVGTRHRGDPAGRDPRKDHDRRSRSSSIALPASASTGGPSARTTSRGTGTFRET
jgi:hypothetical protein